MMNKPTCILVLNNKKYYLKREYIIDNNGQSIFENAIVVTYSIILLIG